MTSYETLPALCIKRSNNLAAFPDYFYHQLNPHEVPDPSNPRYSSRPLKTESVTLMGFYSGNRDILAASVRDYCTGVLKILVCKGTKPAPAGNDIKRPVF